MEFMMKLVLLTVILFFNVSAVFADLSDKGKIQETISQQIGSFQTDDFEKAFTYASPSIKNMFGNYQNFGMMVRRGFPMVWRTKSVLFLDLLTVNDILVQRVMVTDLNDEIHTLNYMMLETSNGWKIRGVTIDSLPST
jgi:uncharacterized UPF0160 family protein